MLAPSETGVPLDVEPRPWKGVQGQSQRYRIGGAVLLATDNLEGKLAGLQTRWAVPTTLCSRNTSATELAPSDGGLCETRPPEMGATTDYPALEHPSTLI
jgi:hypothetical protein